MQQSPIAKTLYRVFSFLPILLLTVAPILIAFLFVLFSDVGKNPVISAIVIIGSSLYLLPLSLRQLVYLFPYKFRTKKNNLLLFSLIVCLVLAGILLHIVSADVYLGILNPCPEGYLVEGFLIRISQTGLLVMYCLFTIVLIALLGILFYRYFNKHIMVSELDVLYLRTFSVAPDFHTLRLISYTLKNKGNYGFALPPRSMLSAWDPYLIAFSGSLFFPFKNLPVLFKEDSSHWKEDIEFLMKNARCIVIDISEIGEGTEWEISTLKKLGLEDKTIVLVEASKEGNARLLKAARSHITYEYGSSISWKPSKLIRDEFSKEMEIILAEQGIKEAVQKRMDRKIGLFLASLFGLTLFFGGSSYLLGNFYPLNIDQAIYFDNKDMVIKFAMQGDADNTGICSMPPLVRALESNNYSVAKMLLDHDANPDIVFYMGSKWFDGDQVPLTWAVNNEDIRAVELLLEYGANPHKLLISGLLGVYTANELAEDSNQSEILRLFSTQSVHDKDTSYWPPLVLALESQSYQDAERMLQAGANPDVKYDFKNKTEDESPLQWAVEKGDMVAMQLLFRYGADPNLELWRGSALIGPSGKNTPLTLAIRKGDVEAVKLLLANGADPYKKLSRGNILGEEYTAIDLANAKNSSEEILFLLYKEAASVTNTPYSTYLGYALWDKKYETAELLLKEGADPTAKVNDLYLPWSAVRNQDTEALKLLLDYGVDPSANLKYALREQKYQSAEFLLKAGADPNATNGSSPLVSAVHDQDTKAVKLLLEYGADPNKAASSPRPGALFERESPLSLAVKQEDVALVQILLQHGADPKKSIGKFLSSSFTAIELAEETKNSEILTLLLNHEK